MTFSRPSFRRALALVGILFVPAALVAASYPGGPDRMLCDLGNYDANRKLMETNRAEAAQLDGELGRTHHLYVAKMQSIEQLVAGRETLRATTWRFIEIDRDSPITIQMVERYPGATYEEKAARYVVEFLKSRLRDGPSGSDVRERVHHQFREMFGGDVDLT